MFYAWWPFSLCWVVILKLDRSEMNKENKKLRSALERQAQYLDTFEVVGGGAGEARRYSKGWVPKPGATKRIAKKDRAS